MAQHWFKYLAAVAVMTAGVVGCTGSGTSNAKMAAAIEREEAWRGQIPPTYTEVKDPKGNLFVVGYPESAAKVAKGDKLKVSKKAFGFGPNGETVTFEDNKIGLGDILVEQYNVKYGKK